MNIVLAHLYICQCQNKLKLNFVKTECMLRNKYYQELFKVDNEIGSVIHYKYLGVMLYPGLSFTNHADMRCENIG